MLVRYLHLLIAEVINKDLITKDIGFVYLQILIDLSKLKVGNVPLLVTAYKEQKGRLVILLIYE